MKRNTQSIEIIRQKTVETEEAKYTYTLEVMEIKRHFVRKPPVYSVRIEMESRDGGYTSAESGYIFFDFGKAIVFYERLAEHLCTPLNLPYVLEDSITVG